METIIQETVTREYHMMVRVNNIGGPASCQSQQDAFSLMRTSEDTPEQTSMETYDRAEPRTYSRRTLDLYRDFLHACRAQGRNLAMEVRAHRLRAQGFASLDAAEAAPA